MAYSDIYDWVRELLQEDSTALPDAKLLRYADSAVNRMILLYPGLGDYDSITGADSGFFDEGVGHLIAARMRPARAKKMPTGDLIRFHTQNMHYQYSDVPKAGALPVEQQWANAAKLAFSQVTAIKAQISARAQSKSPFMVSGPSRAAQNSGQTESLMISILRLLSEEAAEGITSDGADG